MPAVTGPEIERLIQLLARVPGLGPHSARRAALQLIKKREQLLAPLAEVMRVAPGSGLGRSRLGGRGGGRLGPARGRAAGV